VDRKWQAQGQTAFLTRNGNRLHRHIGLRQQTQVRLKDFVLDLLLSALQIFDDNHTKQAPLRMAINRQSGETIMPAREANLQMKEEGE
jgi:hypothetical protein